jgi:hypothetical protein
MPFRYPSLRNGLPIAGYYARLDAGATVEDRFTAGSTQNGTLRNGAIRTDNSGLAYFFDGSNDDCSFGVNAFGSALSGATASTVSLWINYSSLVGTSGQFVNVVFSTRFTSNLAALSFNIRSDTGFVGRPQFGGRSQSSDSFQSVTAGSALTAGTWAHVAAVMNYTADTITIYLNGSATSANVSFGSNTYVSSTGTLNDVMGGNDNTVFYNGFIDDLLIWPRALTATEIGYLALRRGVIYERSAGGIPAVLMEVV